MTDLAPRAPTEDDFVPLARLFTDLWTLAHAACSPPELRRLRTYDDFLRRLHGFGPGLRVIGPQGGPLGFVAVDGEELDQLYVDQTLWGSGVADVLVAEALTMIRAAGFDRAKLYCNPGNGRAAAYYRRSGWQDCGVQEILLHSSEGPFPLALIVFERDTAPRAD